MSDYNEIIKRQMDVIRIMTENNLKRVGKDIFELDEEMRIYPIKTGGVFDIQDKKAAVKSDINAKEEEQTPAENMEALQKELDSYIGMQPIKDEVNNLINIAQIRKLRKEHDLPVDKMSLHMVFTGNPGTGKTMIARYMAKVYKSLGILSKGHLTEVDRSGLVAGYVGQTAIKTSEVIQRTLGGVLFIDEAYALSNAAGASDFGQESIDTILKAMEDKREDFIVIVAGYNDLMEDFIKSNPGLESRFNKYLRFEDYSIDELVDIFAMFCKKGFYTLSDQAIAAAKELIEYEIKTNDAYGNARGVRNNMEKCLTYQANRLAAQREVTREELMEIQPGDILKVKKQIQNEKG